MEYQDSAATVQATESADAPAALRLAIANINPATGLATDYLNHFNEAIMLLEMLPACPDCRADFLDWRAKSYREHFADSHSQSRDIAIAAYETADLDARESLDALAGTMTAVLEAARAAMRADLPPEVASALAHRTSASLKPLVARAGAVINGDANGSRPVAPQTIVDALMKR